MPPDSTGSRNPLLFFPAFSYEIHQGWNSRSGDGGSRGEVLKHLVERDCQSGFAAAGKSVAALGIDLFDGFQGFPQEGNLQLGIRVFGDFPSWSRMGWVSRWSAPGCEPFDTRVRCVRNCDQSWSCGFAPPGKVLMHRRWRDSGLTRKSAN